jgi:ABC-2 type transport system permease protein
MTTEPLVDSPAPQLSSPTRPMYWSIRREIWENRSIYAAPVVCACITLFGFLVSAITLPHRMRLAMGDPAKLHSVVAMPYDTAAGLILVTAFLVGFFYCLDALHGERRDRSILFWKSLPVSDLTTVLSKLAIPMVVLPAVSWVATVATQLIMLVMRGSGAPWGEVAGSWPMILYHLLTVHSLYYAPIFAWLLLVSAWARRMPFLWAFLPIAAVAIVERIAFRSSYFAHMLGSRISGDMEMKGAPMLGYFMPLDFFTKPGLWIGFLVAAVFIAVAVRLRRLHGPI